MDPADFGFLKVENSTSSSCSDGRKRGFFFHIIISDRTGGSVWTARIIAADLKMPLTWDKYGKSVFQLLGAVFFSGSFSSSLQK